MLEWQDYVSHILADSASFDGIRLSFEDSEQEFEVPPIIKASILMLDKMLQHQGPFNILVFPERIQSIFIFSIIKLLYNISEGRIDQSYDPEKFIPGEKLKLGKAVVEFMRIEVVDGKKHMRLRLSDLEDSAPIEFFPLFQKTTASRISPDLVLSKAKKEAKKQLHSTSPEEKLFGLLADYKTHMDSSIIYMTSIINAKELAAGCKLCGAPVKDLILIGQADYEGNVKNIGAGMLGGVPAIILASDLYAMSALAEKGHPIQSIIIDASNANALASQLPELDNLLRLGIPITCVTDIVDSFDLKPLLERGFNLWRWDETSITDKLYDACPLSSDRKTKHCANRKVEYLITDGNEISTAIKLLYLHRKESQTASAQMLKLFGKLFSLAFTALHETVPFSESECVLIKASLEECNQILKKEKSYLSPIFYKDFETIIECLRKIYTYGFNLPKHGMLVEKMRSIKYSCFSRIAFIVPDKTDKKRTQYYWKTWCESNGLVTEIDVLYPAEYCTAPCDQYNSTIVVGWLMRAIMRKTLYSFNTQSYTVLLYDYEKRWKNFDSNKWNATLNSAENRKTIEKSFATDKIKISTSRFEPRLQETTEIPEADELTEIQTILRENKYRQYVASGGRKAENETVEAIPVNYVGGYLAFYRTGHKIISASDIIENDAEKIETKYPADLRMGEFVVVREADRDLIKEMADIILERSGISDKRDIAGKWKEALMTKRQGFPCRSGTFAVAMFKVQQ